MTRLFLNSYALSVSGDVRLFRAAGVASGRTRNELRDKWGVSVFVQDDDAWTFAAPPVDCEEFEESLVPVDGLSLFAVREGIVEHCRSLGLDAAVSRGEVRVLGIAGNSTFDRFTIEPMLLARVHREAYIKADAVLTVRHRFRWRTTTSLADPDVRQHAEGESAVRIGGDGPRRGRILDAGASSSTLLAGGEEVAVSSDAYALAATGALIVAWRGSDVLRGLRVAAGDMTVTGRRNRHGVEDRFKRAGDAVRGLGERVDLPGGGSITIPRLAIDVRLEERR